MVDLKFVSEGSRSEEDDTRSTYTESQLRNLIAAGQLDLGVDGEGRHFGLDESSEHRACASLDCDFYEDQTYFTRLLMCMRYCGAYEGDACLELSRRKDEVFVLGDIVISGSLPAIGMPSCQARDWALRRWS